MIEVNGSELNQWDTGRGVIVTGIEAEYVHFANQGDSKAVIMGLVDIDATIPDFLLQTGRPLLVYAVKDGITLESRMFSVKKRPRPENYAYEDDQRNYIYELITDAENATESANYAAGEATKAAQSAGESASSAVLATDNANVAAESANLAAQSANEAAAKAAHTAKSLMVVGTASGETIALDDAIDQYLVGCRIFGKTTQDGTPTPGAPVDLVSVENPTIAVNEQSMLVPYTLRGIPVSSGGNYTDANGQQWVCDEVDFAMGVYIQRVGAYAYTGEESWFISTAQNPALVEAGMVRYDAVIAQYPKAATSQVLSSHCRFVGLNSFDEASGIGAWVYADPNYLAVRIVTDIDAVSGLKTWLANQYASSTPVTILYIMAAPIEIPLSEYELTAYATLQTARGITTVSNDAGAYMEIQYVMDAKKYIDSLIGTGGAYAGLVEATVE